MNFKDKTITTYEAYTRKKLFFGVLLGLALIIAAIFSIKVGAANLSVYDIINSFINRQASRSFNYMEHKNTQDYGSYYCRMLYGA